jgi:hypothetical protein
MIVVIISIAICIIFIILCISYYIYERNKAAKQVAEDQT